MNSRQKILAVVAVVTIIVSLVVIGRRYVKSPGKDVLGLGVVGEVAAEETRRLLVGSGKIAVIYFELSGLRGQGGELVYQSFLRRIRAAGGISIVATETVPLGPSAPYLAAQLLKKYSTADVVVFIGGMSDVSSVEFLSLPRPLPKTIAVLTFGSERTKQLLEEGVLSVAIEYPLYPNPVPKPIRKPRDLFDATLVVVTTNNIGDLRLQPADRVTRDSEQ